jgi:hypothetical protein
MSLKFDKKTGSLMEPVITDVLKFVSITGDVRDANDEETLLFETENIDSSLVVSNIDIFLKNAIKDRTNPRKYMHCPFCKKDLIGIPIRSGSKIINVCTKCNKSWV